MQSKKKQIELIDLLDYKTSKDFEKKKNWKFWSIWLSFISEEEVEKKILIWDVCFERAYAGIKLRKKLEINKLNWAT